MKEIYLNRLNTLDLQNLINNGSIDKVIIPIGSCESHGNHLPLGTDIIISKTMSEIICEKCPGTIIAPPIPFGTSINYNQYPLSISLRYETNIMMIEDILTSLLEHGLKNLIILNGHDGNIPALEIAARNVKNIYRDSTILIIPGWWYYSRTVLKNNYKTVDGKGHGGEAETSLMLAIENNLVHQDRACCQIHKDVYELSKHGNMVIWDISEVSKTGTTGDSIHATKEKGEILLEEFTSYIIGIIKKLDKSNWKYDNKK